MKKLFVSFSILALGLSVISFVPQKDAKAEEILKNLSSKSKSYTSIKADFTYSVKSEDIDEKRDGKLILAGEKYRYNLFGVVKICDGTSIAEVNEMDEEIILTSVNYNDPDEMSPKDMFTIYEKGFKYRFIKDITENGKTLHVIELYPEVEKDSPYRRITLYIDKDDLTMKKVEFSHKTTSKVFTFTINKYEFNSIIPTGTFKVDCSIRENFDCDDQRGAK